MPSTPDSPRHEQTAAHADPADIAIERPRAIRRSNRPEHRPLHDPLNVLRKLPPPGSGEHNEPLVYFGGFLLSLIAGYLNIVLIAAGTLPVTHVTGTVSRLSGDIAGGNAADIALVLPLFACFILGAGISGVVIGKASLKLGRPYGVAMLIEAGLIGLAAVLIRGQLFTGMLLIAIAAGLQNGMASSYGGLIIRTTHLTGIATDLGFLIGRWLRHREVAGWKFALLIVILLAFFLGGLAGAAAWGTMRHDSLWLPAAALGLVGGWYFVWRLCFRDRRIEVGSADQPSPAKSDTQS